MQTPSIRLIPAEYLDRVKGNVSTRQMLAREADLPKVVLDRLVCDRSKSVREYAAKNPGLDAEQVQELIDGQEYAVTYELNRNFNLSHELVVVQVKNRWGVKDNMVFRNPNIKASEFVDLVKEYLTTSGASTWSKRSVYQSAAANEGVGNGAVIALTEWVYSNEGKDMYETILEQTFRNVSLSSRSLQYLLDKSNRRLNSNFSLIKTAVSHPNASNEFIDSVVIDSINNQENVLRAFDFSETYEASEEVIETLSKYYPNNDSEFYLSFLANHVPTGRFTPERAARVEFTSSPETATALLLKGVELSEQSIDRLVMVVAMSSDDRSIDRLSSELYIKSHHVDQMARSGSWSIRHRAAAMYNVSEEMLKKLAIDSDSDVRRAARNNPKWEKVREAVEEQEVAYRFSEKVRTVSRHAEDISTSLLEKYGDEFQSLKPVLDAIAVLADPKTRELMNSFKVEESRNLMKDGIDADTLSLLKDFF